MIPSSPILLSTAYLPPIQYLSKFFFDVPVFIEKHENYQKQSYRNRCYIYGANGRQCLVIPVKKHHGVKTPIAEVEIDYTENWQKIHLKSFESAYRLSAFYEYYADDFKAFFEAETPLLFDFNFNLLMFMLDLLGVKNAPGLSAHYESGSGNYPDYRQSIHPKERMLKPDPAFLAVAYQQVFQERYGFIPNLSIVDLLFNEGPLAGEIIRRGMGLMPIWHDNPQ